LSKKVIGKIRTATKVDVEHREVDHMEDEDEDDDGEKVEDGCGGRSCGDGRHGMVIWA
jgi:hypothetical protein